MSGQANDLVEPGPQIETDRMRKRMTMWRGHSCPRYVLHNRRQSGKAPLAIMTTPFGHLLLLTQTQRNLESKATPKDCGIPDSREQWTDRSRDARLSGSQ